MSRLRPSRRLGLRARLTLSIGLLFVLAGLALLGATYALVDRQLEREPPPLLADHLPGDAPEKAAGEFTLIDQEGNAYVGGDATRLLETDQREALSEAAREVLTQGALALVVVGGIAVALVWVVSGRILAPLRRVTETARRIADAPATEHVLHERIALTGREDEVADLASSFDTMMEKLDQTFTGQRRFVDNAAHELRTPLTTGRALIELVLQNQDAPPQVRKLGAELLRTNEKHERLIDGLLLLAKADHEVEDRSLIDLADLVEHTLHQASIGDTHLETDLGEALTRGDALLLERVVHNLVDNASRHNRPDGWIRVSSRSVGLWVELEIENTGPVVPADEVPELFRPFRRAGGDRLVADGVGLGMSIVASIARAHHGEAVATARPGGGLVVTVRLPAAEPTDVPLPFEGPG
ncbi:sensor histidine kinase [Nocardioides speluncae]|uniref:sensor histidine kinase n=1 Tax=Nocardioides speluncae TaxID=2670337 RepID=UPI000D695000|nr:ATP-binding protein [Nocardioides speluncae]